MNRDETTGTFTGLTGEEAKTFHGLFMSGFIGFTVIAIIAHFLVWTWRPWFPSTEGYSALPDAGALANVLTMLT